jgi:hypothetical protein
MPLRERLHLGDLSRGGRRDGLEPRLAEIPLLALEIGNAACEQEADNEKWAKQAWDHTAL